MVIIIIARFEHSVDPGCHRHPAKRHGCYGDALGHAIVVKMVGAHNDRRSPDKDAESTAKVTWLHNVYRGCRERNAAKPERGEREFALTPVRSGKLMSPLYSG